VQRPGSRREDREVGSSSALNQVELRLKRPRGAQGGADGAISVAQLKVPQKAQDRYNKAREALAKGKYDEAEKQVADSLAICPKNARALTLRGVLAVRKQQTAAAMQDFQSALEVDPNYEPAYTAMGDVYNSQGRFDDAARTTERAVALAPNAWQGYFEMARAYIGKGMYKKGLEVATRAQSLGGADVTPGIHLLKAYAMVPLKLYKDASQELQAFLAHATQGQNTEPVKSLLAQVQAAEAAAATAPAGMAFAPRQ
jgi:tetratricopeptide (TPR) repeat protein